MPVTKFKPEVIKKLVLPLLNAKMKEGETIYVKCTGKIYEGKPQKNAKEGDKPADLMPCVNLETGEDGEIIVASVVKSSIEETYPNHAYVGHGFAITKGKKPEGKRYFQYTVDEVKV